jgi:hypothetical protein
MSVITLVQAHFVGHCFSSSVNNVDTSTIGAPGGEFCVDKAAMSVITLVHAHFVGHCFSSSVNNVDTSTIGAPGGEFREDKVAMSVITLVHVTFVDHCFSCRGSRRASSDRLVVFFVRKG